MSYSVTFEGFSSKAEAEEFIHWYSGSGEQFAEEWLAERKAEGLIEHCSFTVDSRNTWDLKNKKSGEKLKFLKETKNNITVSLKINS